MKDLASQLTDATTHTFCALAYDPAYAKVKRADRRDLADFQCNGALALAKTVGRKPQEISASLAAIWSATDLADRPGVAGPGFLNFRLTAENRPSRAKVVMPNTAPLDRYTLQAEREFRASVRPVYRNNAANPRPLHVGSCLLLNVDGVPLVVTAAHILDQRASEALYIGGLPGSRPVHIVGGITMATPKRDAGRASDHFDTAIWIPPPQTVDMLGAVAFLDHSRISYDRKPSTGTLYTALGYPVSRNKKAIDHVTRSISTHISMYTANAEEMPALASKLGITGSDHLFLRFERLSLVMVRI